MSTIKTYTTAAFRDQFMQPGQQLDTLLQTDFGKFFIVRVEDLIRLIKLPVPPARATTHTLIYLTQGEAIMHIGSERYTIYEDECLVVPAGQVFSFDNLDINQGYLCNFHPDLLINKLSNQDTLQDFEFLHVWGNPRIHLGDQTSAYVQQLLQRLLADYTENGLKNLSRLQAYFLALLYEINSVYQPLSGAIHTTAVSITNKFKELVFVYLKTAQLVTDYAAMLHISPNHLNKAVKAMTGKSPTVWIDEALVVEAKMLLYQTTLSISQVAAEIGFSDPSYFSRLFKKYTGTTPLQFRRMIEKS